MTISYRELNLSEFEKLTSNTNSSLLCGNGFSINFDDRLSMNSLGKSLYNAHCTWKACADYKIISNQAFKDGLKANYSNAKKIINRIKSEKDLENFFCCAIAFATEMIENEVIMNWIDTKGLNSTLVFGVSQIDIINEIISQAKTKSVLCVNYEYWSLMVYYILALNNAPEQVYKLDKNNVFVNAVLSGAQYNFTNQKKDLSSASITAETIINGVAIYLCFLFAINILLDGSGVSVTRLTNWGKINGNKINEFFSRFDELLTTNYDLIIEKITGRSVKHLHGEYSKSEKVIFYQSMSVFFDLNKYDLSTITVGDYFTEKTFFMSTA